MKLGRAGEPRGNRFTRAGDVLKVKEEPEAAWDQQDVAKAVELLEHWQKNSWIVGHLVASLDMIAPGTVRPEQRAAIVEFLLTRMKEDLGQVGVRKVNKDSLVSDTGALLLVDPSARSRIPEMERIRKELAPYFGNLDDFVNTSAAPQLTTYALMESDGKKLTDQAWQKVMDRAKKRWEAGSKNSYLQAIKTLQYARIISPERFFAHPPSDDMRQSLLVHSKKYRISAQDEIIFSSNLFYSLILAAEEVSVTKEHGLRVRLPAAKISPGSKLPERNTV